MSGLWGTEVREPRVEVCFQTIVKHRDPSLQQPLRPLIDQRICWPFDIRRLMK